LMLISMRAPVWLSTFYFGAAAVSLLSLIITRWWKISAHAGAVGGVAGGMYWLACHGLLMNPVLWLCIVIALTGLLCWSRLYLGRHTVLQVIAGAVMAFLVEYGMLCLI
ncbi:MAG: phosphatase PAP2 family protein, partial [Muribaculaceae bacterium]|nr:phosphatase PAP2 family protein [Muribaculaceae bacterium]